MLGFENAGKKTFSSPLAKFAVRFSLEPAFAFVSYLAATGQCAVVGKTIARNYPHTVG